MYTFTTDWFDQSAHIWVSLIEKFKPVSMLEVGSFEGKSACFAIQEASKHSPSIILHCVDTWEGSAEHVGMEQLKTLEQTFEQNVQFAMLCAQEVNPTHQVDITKCKGKSQRVLPELICKNHQYDWVYIDGSHMAPDVLVDACMAFQLLRVGGIMISDDYMITDRETAETLPEKMHHARPAIDTFTTIFRNKTKQIIFKEDDGTDCKTYQYYMQKISE